MNRRKYGNLVNRRAWGIVALILAVGLALVLGAAMKPGPVFQGQPEEPARWPGPEGEEHRELSPDSGAVIGSGDERTETFPVLGDGEVSGDSRPELALLVDDFGYNTVLAERLAVIDMPLTWAILPYLRHSTEVARLAQEMGIPYLLHLPMQAEADGEDGPFLVGTAMGSDEIRQVVHAAVSSLPGLSGINNHRGSLATSDVLTMEAVLDVVSAEGLFLVDSRTSSRSVAYDRARQRDIPALYNGIFLDNKTDAEYISQKLDSAMERARREGWALAICHVRPGTVAYLEEFASALPDDVRFVTVPELISRHGSR